MSAEPLYTVEFRESDRRWIVQRQGVRRVTSVHLSRSDAEYRARVMARRQRCDVIVLAADGSVERRYSSDSLANRSSVIRAPRRSRYMS